MGHRRGTNSSFDPRALYATGEIVRAITLGFYLDLVDHPFVVENGRMQPPQRPGLGVALRPEALERDDCRITTLV